MTRPRLFGFCDKVLRLFSEHRMGTSGPREGGKGDVHETHGRGENLRHAPEAQGQHAAFPRRDAARQGIVQVPGVVGGSDDGGVADHIPRHQLLSGRSMTQSVPE